MRKDFNIGERKILVDIDSEKGIIKVNDIIFTDKAEFIYYVNKLTDIAEAILQDNNEE